MTRGGSAAAPTGNPASGDGSEGRAAPTGNPASGDGSEGRAAGSRDSREGKVEGGRSGEGGGGEGRAIGTQRSPSNIVPGGHTRRVCCAGSREGRGEAAAADGGWEGSLPVPVGVMPVHMLVLGSYLSPM